MKLTAEANYYIEEFGAKAGIEYLKNLGYQNIIYTLTARTLEPFLSKSSDEQMEQVFGTIREAANEAGVNILFAIMKEEIYNDQNPNALKKNKLVYKQGVKASAYLGCKFLGVRPVCLRYSSPCALEDSEMLTYEIYSEIKEEADKYGVRLAFVNNTKQLCFTSGTYSYGCRGNELLELAEEFGAGIIVNPVYALKVGERVEDMLTEVKDKLIGFCIDDKSQRTIYQTFPMFGCVDYESLIDFFKNYKSDAAAVMMYSQIFNRYSEFSSDQDIVDTVSSAFFKMGCLISGRETYKIGKEQL